VFIADFRASDRLLFLYRLVIYEELGALWRSSGWPG